MLKIILILTARAAGWSISLFLASALWDGAHAADAPETLVLQAFQSIPEHHKEWAGVVIQHVDGSLSITAPAVSNEFNFRLHVSLQPGDRITVVYHTHPGYQSEAQVFSTDDIDVANKLHVVSYILFEKTGQIRRYVPNLTETSTLNTERHELTAVGDKVS